MICYKYNTLLFKNTLKEEKTLSNKYSNRFVPVLLLMFTISLFFVTVFIVGCGDEGDSPTDMVEGDAPTDMVDQTDDHSTHDHEPVIVAPTPDPEEPEDPAVTFRNDILPILAESCALANCHTGLPAAGGLDLTDYTSFKDGGGNGAAFVPGDGTGSLVVQRIDGGGMPPIGPPLTAEQIQFFIDWIDDGAENN